MLIRLWLNIVQYFCSGSGQQHVLSDTDAAWVWLVARRWTNSRWSKNGTNEGHNTENIMTALCWVSQTTIIFFLCDLTVHHLTGSSWLLPLQSLRYINTKEAFVHSQLLSSAQRYFTTRNHSENLKFVRVTSQSTELIRCRRVYRSVDRR